MPELAAFDANCTVGRHVRLGPRGPHTTVDLLCDMDRHGVAEALVVEVIAREGHPAPGNERIIEEAAASPRLHPAWVALPPGAVDEQPKPEELVRRMREHRVGALFLFTGQYAFGLEDWCVDDLVGPLAEARGPLFINPNDFGPRGPAMDETDWGQVVALCRRWPDLPVIVSERRIRRSQRVLYRALDACANLRIELSGYWLYRGIEYVTGRWGPERLVFGSNWPTFGQALTLAPLAAAEISDDAKRMIAGGNLRELVSWCEPVHPEAQLPEPEDEFVRFARTGERPSDMTFRDSHGHLGGHSAHYHVPNGSLEETVREMDRFGIERACVFSLSGVTSDEVCGNNVVAEACRRYPDRFVGFALVNPHRGPEEMLAELERCAGLGLRGVKLIAAYQGYPDEGPNIEVAVRWAHERGQIVLNHQWGSAAEVERLASAYPNACLVTGHSTAAYADVMKRHSNIYVGTCPLTGPRACEELVAALGAERILFGSDLQDLPVAWGLGPVLAARISPREKRLILGENLERILEQFSMRA
jgi:predicted TIM-barrel fold metal-dependent hydrolase